MNNKRTIAIILVKIFAGVFSCFVLWFSSLAGLSLVPLYLHKFYPNSQAPLLRFITWLQKTAGEDYAIVFAAIIIPIWFIIIILNQWFLSQKKKVKKDTEQEDPNRPAGAVD